MKRAIDKLNGTGAHHRVCLSAAVVGMLVVSLLTYIGLYFDWEVNWLFEVHVGSLVISFLGASLMFTRNVV